MKYMMMMNVPAATGEYQISNWSPTGRFRKPRNSWQASGSWTRATAGFQDSAARLLHEIAPQVLGVVARKCGDFADAEDAVQEALIAAAAQWPLAGIPANPRGACRTSGFVILGVVIAVAYFVTPLHYSSPARMRGPIVEASGITLTVAGATCNGRKACLLLFQ